MKKFLFLLVVGALWPLSAGAVSPDQIAGNLYQKTVKHPENVAIWGLKGPLGNSAYREFIFAQADILLGKQESISLASLLKKPYFTAEFSGLTQAQKDRLAEIAEKQEPANIVSEPELLAMLVLLDANLEYNEYQEKEMFKMDAYSSLGKTGGIIEARSDEITRLVKYMSERTRAKVRAREKEMADRQAQREEEERQHFADQETKAKNKLADVHVFNADGSLNEQEIPNVISELSAFTGSKEGAPYLTRVAQAVFGKKLKSAEWTGTRACDVKVELTDGTQIATNRSFTTEITVKYPNGEERKI